MRYYIDGQNQVLEIGKTQRRVVAIEDAACVAVQQPSGGGGTSSRAMLLRASPMLAVQHSSKHFRLVTLSMHTQVRLSMTKYASEKFPVHHGWCA